MLGKCNCIISVTHRPHTHKVLLESWHEINSGGKIGRESRDKKVTGTYISHWLPRGCTDSDLGGYRIHVFIRRILSIEIATSAWVNGRWMRFSYWHVRRLEIFRFYLVAEQFWWLPPKGKRWDWGKINGISGRRWGSRGGLHILLESKTEEGKLLDSLTLLPTTKKVPHHHKQNFHPLGRLWAFLSISKK